MLQYSKHSVFFPEGLFFNRKNLVRYPLNSDNIWQKLKSYESGVQSYELSKRLNSSGRTLNLGGRDAPPQRGIGA